jgi:ankyrin repeat domain-containing protein 50
LTLTLNTAFARSIVIARLEALANASNGQICVGYVYIRYSDQDQVTIRGILEVLVKQTVERHPECSPLCEQAYNRHLKEGTQPTEEELVSLLRLFNQQFKATFYVVDALDEAPVRIRLKILQKLSSLGARLFITSRPLPALEAKFPAAHTFHIQAKDEDLDLHIAEKITESEDLQDLLDRGGPAFEARLISTVKEKCGGMYVLYIPPSCTIQS